MIVGETVDNLKLDTIVTPDFGFGISKGLAERLGWKAGKIIVSRFDVPADDLKQPFKLEVTGENTFKLLMDDVAVLSGRVGRNNFV